MSLAPQLPGKASVSFVRGDDWGATFDFNVDATGYTWAAAIFSVVTGQTLLAPSVSVVSASLGQVSVSLTDLQTSTLAAGTYGLRLTFTAPGGVVRRSTEGLVEVYA